MIKCPICKNENDESTIKKLESNCLFLSIEGIDQHIIRYQCNTCNVIFGPNEMINLESSKLIKAYQDVYASGHREGDATKFEFDLFKMLNPDKSGVYINWGSGTSRTSDSAFQDGYTLLNYDPGLPSMSGYLTQEELEHLTMKVDGIISNNVLDHLQNPIIDLFFMKSLLKSGGCMIHASDGFQYKIDYTKFHLFFSLENQSILLVTK